MAVSDKGKLPLASTKQELIDELGNAREWANSDTCIKGGLMSLRISETETETDYKGRILRFPTYDISVTPEEIEIMRVHMGIPLGTGILIMEKFYVIHEGLLELSNVQIRYFATRWSEGAISVYKSQGHVTVGGVGSDTIYAAGVGSLFLEAETGFTNEFPHYNSSTTSVMLSNSVVSTTTGVEVHASLISNLPSVPDWAPEYTRGYSAKVYADGTQQYYSATASEYEAILLASRS